MPGEENLNRLLKSMKPTLNPGEYVFCTHRDLTVPGLTDAILFFREQEGVTLVLPKEKADTSVDQYPSLFSWITLAVHSSLEAVGLTAACSHALGAAGISCNIVAAYFHDHIFVTTNQAEQAMEVLKRLSNSSMNDPE